jgi:splicing factor 3B subunit 3
VVYKHADNRLVVFADDTIPRWMTASTMVDYDTVAGGDKFGNFFVDRLPSLVSREVDEDTTGNRIYHEKGYLQGAANKVTKHIMDLLSYTFLIFPFLF